MKLFKKGSLCFIAALPGFLLLPVGFIINNMHELNNSWQIIGLTSLIILIALSILCLVCNFLQDRCINVIQRILCFFSIYIFLMLYFIVPRLGKLDGTEFIFDRFTCILDILAIIISGYLVMKVTIKKIRNIIYLITIFSSVTIFVNCFSSKNILDYDIDCHNYNKFSKNKNIVVLVLDTVGSVFFENLIMLYPEFKTTLKDFEWYKNATSIGGETAFAIPAIFTRTYPKSNSLLSVRNVVQDYSLKSECNFLVKLKQLGYKNYIFPFIKQYHYLSPKIIDNLLPTNSFSLCNMFVYTVVFRFLATPLVWKKNSYNELTLISLNYKNINFNSYDDHRFYDKFTPISVDPGINDTPTFHFYHLRGMHRPYMFDQNMNKVYPLPNKIKTSAELQINLISRFIKFMKKNKFYDNSAIIIMGDHGSESHIDSKYQPQSENAINTLFLYKNVNQKQEAIKELDDIFDVKDTYSFVLHSANNLLPKIDVCKSEQNMYKDILDRKKKQIDFNWEVVPYQNYEIAGNLKYDIAVWEQSKFYLSIVLESPTVFDYDKVMFILRNTNNKEINYILSSNSKVNYLALNLKFDKIPPGEYFCMLLAQKKEKLYRIDLGIDIANIDNLKVDFRKELVK